MRRVGATDPTGGVDLVLDSLQRRMRALFSLYEDAVATMDLDQVNHFEREGVLPIAFSLFHIVNMIDASFLLMTGTPPIWDDAWAARVHPAIADHGKHRTVEEMVHQRIGDYEQFQAYMRAVFDRVEAVAGRARPGRADPAGDPPAVPRADRQHLQRPGGRSRGDHPARCHRVLDLPARTPSHGGDRAGPGTGGPGGHDLLGVTAARDARPADAPRPPQVAHRLPLTRRLYRSHTGARRVTVAVPGTTGHDQEVAGHGAHQTSDDGAGSLVGTAGEWVALVVAGVGRYWPRPPRRRRRPGACR